MVKFQSILSSVVPADFKFINQRTVKVSCLVGIRLSSFLLSKADVVLSINKYLDDIHHFSDKPVRGEGMNFKAFKMHDLVPYLYTLINLYLTICSESCYCYHRYLPELKLTRFCRLAFEDEIIELPELPKLEVECAYLSSPLTHTCSYVALLNPSHSVSYVSINELRDKLQSLYPMHNVILHVVGS